MVILLDLLLVGPIVAGALLVLEFDIRTGVRTLLGRAEGCRTELYNNGLRIWRGPGIAEPSWSFLYSDLVQAECVTLSGGAKYSPSTTFVRSSRRSPGWPS